MSHSLGLRSYSESLLLKYFDLTQIQFNHDGGTITLPWSTLPLENLVEQHFRISAIKRWIYHKQKWFVGHIYRGLSRNNAPDTNIVYTMTLIWVAHEPQRTGPTAKKITHWLDIVNYRLFSEIHSASRRLMLWTLNESEKTLLKRLRGGKREREKR